MKFMSIPYIAVSYCRKESVLWNHRVSSFVPSQATTCNSILTFYQLCFCCTNHFISEKQPRFTAIARCFVTKCPFHSLDPYFNNLVFYYHEIISYFPRAAVMIPNLSSHPSHHLWLWSWPVKTPPMCNKEAECLSGPMLPTLQNCFVLQYLENQTVTFYIPS